VKVRLLFFDDFFVDGGFLKADAAGLHWSGALK
jgi:hypothetical protein